MTCSCCYISTKELTSVDNEILTIKLSTPTNSLRTRNPFHWWRSCFERFHITIFCSALLRYFHRDCILSVYSLLDLLAAGYSLDQCDCFCRFYHIHVRRKCLIHFLFPSLIKFFVCGCIPKDIVWQSGSREYFASTFLTKNRIFFNVSLRMKPYHTKMNALPYRQFCEQSPDKPETYTFFCETGQIRKNTDKILLIVLL